MDELGELEPTFDLDLEPQFRERSNTWPLRPNRVELESHPNGGSPSSESGGNVGVADGGQVVIKQEKGASGCSATGPDSLGQTVKKSGARRNAWGSLSYADLITNAIQSSPDKRLTLSQIYDWMVQNVPYFKDKGDSTSSAGWKNSIRHNLSLHSRFMRIQNEGTGKSSWWVINPDAKPGKAPRRRAGSMDTKSGEKKRGRINKKKQEAIRAALENRGSPLNGSIDFLDTLAMGDFRSRASSNASSCSRLSPIPPDLHDNQVPPMSPIPWDGEAEVAASGYQGGDNFPDLVSSLADSMNLSSQESMDLSTNLNSDPYLSSGVVQEFANSPQNFKGLVDGLNEPNQFSHLPAPPPYPEHKSPVQTTQPQSSMITSQEQPSFSSTSMSNLRRTLLSSFAKSPDLFANNIRLLNLLNSQLQLSVKTQPQTLGTSEGSQQNSPNAQSLASHLSPSMDQASLQQEEMKPINHQLSPQQQQQVLLGSSEPQVDLAARVEQQNVLQQQQQEKTTKSILRSALTHGSVIFSQPATAATTQFILGLNQPAPSTANTSNMNIASLGLSTQRQIQQLQQQQQQPQQQQQVQQLQPQQQQQPQQLQQLSSSSTSFLSQLNQSDSDSTAPVVNNVIMNGISSTLGNGNNNLPVDIDMDSFMSLPDYDMEQVIKQELSLEGNLDANFDNITPA